MEKIIENLLIGIVGGIISGFFVSRFFMIQGGYQSQIDYFENTLNSLTYVKAYLEVSKKILEIKYDTQEVAKKESKDMNYSSIEQYYINHKEKDWISASEAINVIIKKMNESIELRKNVLLFVDIKEKDLLKLYNEALMVLTKAQNIKDFSFKSVNERLEEIDDIENKYQLYRKEINKKLFILMVKDKIMIMFYVLLFILAFVVYFL